MTNLDQQWVGVDQARLLPSRDQEVAARFASAAAGAKTLADSFPGVLHEMRECQQGQPQAMRTEPTSGGKPTTWCAHHETELHRCQDDDLEGCVPEIIPRRTDPTGEAGIQPDTAAAHYRDHLKDAATLVIVEQRMAQRASLYPAAATTPPVAPGEEGPGDGWCVNHYRAGQAFAPERLRPNGQPVKRGACGWCIDMHQAHGFYPPPELVDLHDRNVRITAGMWDEAKKRNPQRTKDKKGKRAKVRQAQWTKEQA